MGGFFTAQEKLQTTVREEEKKAKAAPIKDVSLNQQALDRVLAQRRMEQMEVELRETLVYHAPPELGAIYTDFLKMRAAIQQEQSAARRKQEQTERQREWKKQQLISAIQDKLLYILATLFVVIYMVVLAYVIVLDRQVRWGF